MTADALQKRQSAFKLVVVDSSGGFAESVRSEVGRVAPHVPVSIASNKPEEAFDALVISGSRALDAPDWVRLFAGSRIVVPDEAPGLVWAGGVSEDAIRQAAQAVRQLAEGQPLRARTGGSAWRIVIYVAAGLFGLIVLLMLFGLVMSTLVG